MWRIYNKNSQILKVFLVAQQRRNCLSPVFCTFWDPRKKCIFHVSRISEAFNGTLISYVRTIDAQVCTYENWQDYFFQSSPFPVRQKMKAKPMNNSFTNNATTSGTARKILETLEKMTTPLGVWYWYTTYKILIESFK